MKSDSIVQKYFLSYNFDKRTWFNIRLLMTIITTWQARRMIIDLTFFYWWTDMIRVNNHSVARNVDKIITLKIGDQTRPGNRKNRMKTDFKKAKPSWRRFRQWQTFLFYRFQFLVQVRQRLTRQITERWSSRVMFRIDYTCLWAWKMLQERRQTSPTASIVHLLVLEKAGAIRLILKSQHQRVKDSTSVNWCQLMVTSFLML